MANGFIQGNNAATNAAAYTSPNTLGNLLVLTCRLTVYVSLTSITDTAGNVWTIVSNQAIGTAHSVFAYAKNCKAGANTVTVNSVFAFSELVIAEYSGVDAINPFDQFAYATGSSTTPASGNTPSTTSANELVLGWCQNETANGRTITQGAGYQLDQTGNGNVGLESKIVSSTGVQAADFSYSGGAVSWACGAATFVLAPGVPVVADQPANQSVASGSTATFTASIEGTPAPTYQWYKNGILIGGATSSSYTTPVTSASDDGTQYYVIGTNVSGSVQSSTAILFVAPPSPLFIQSNSGHTANGVATGSVAYSSNNQAGSLLVLHSTQPILHRPSLAQTSQASISQQHR